MNKKIFILGLLALSFQWCSIQAIITDRTFLISPEQHKYIMELDPIARDTFINQNKTTIVHFFKKNIPARLDDFRSRGPLERSPTFPQYMRTHTVIVEF